MQSNITVTELLNKLRKDKKQNNNDKESDYSSMLEIEDTHTEIQESEQDELEPLHEEIEELRDIIEKLTKRIEKLESERNAKIYREHVEFKEVNPLYNTMFNVPENERTYKPIIVKEEVKPNGKENLFSKTKKNNNQNRKRSQSKHRKYK